jgi:hypothetical protein
MASLSLREAHIQNILEVDQKRRTEKLFLIKQRESSPDFRVVRLTSVIGRYCFDMTGVPVRYPRELLAKKKTLAAGYKDDFKIYAIYTLAQMNEFYHSTRELRWFVVSIKEKE